MSVPLNPVLEARRQRTRRNLIADDLRLQERYPTAVARAWTPCDKHWATQPSQAQFAAIARACRIADWSWSPICCQRQASRLIDELTILGLL